MEKSLQENLNHIALEMQRESHDRLIPDVELLNKFTGQLLALGNSFRQSEPELSLTERCDSLLQSIKKADNSHSLQETLPTGFTAIDRIIQGLPLGQLIILGARPGMGKTAFLISLLHNLLKQDIACGYFSIESSADQVIHRLLSQMSDVQLSDILTLNLDDKKTARLETEVQTIKSFKLTIKDQIFSIDEIIAETDFLVREHGVKIIFVDYLQLIKIKSRRENTREADVSRLSRELKALARKYNIVVIASSQLSRAVETRGGDKRPMLSDLRESGAIEQDADKVFFLYRPEYYGIELGVLGYKTAGLAEIIISKNRDGMLGDAWLSFRGAHSHFCDKLFMGDANEDDSSLGTKFSDMRKDEF